MKNLLSLVVIVLVLVVVLQRTGCNSIPGFERPKSDTTIVHDTSWSVHDSLIYSKPKPGKIVYMPPSIEYLADTNYDRLKIQYDSLLREYFALKTYADTVRLDSLGWIAIADSVQKNGLLGRSFHTNYKIPTITKTVTINNYALPKTQVYLGGGIGINKTLGVTNVQVGGILKTKSDKIFGLSVGSTVNGDINYGFSSYWKIKLR